MLEDKMGTENLAEKIRSWEYCFCQGCNRMIVASDLVITAQGIQCSKCGHYNLEEPGWVICPHQKISAVKCPRAGKGIVHNESGIECADRCYFRTCGE